MTIVLDLGMGITEKTGQTEQTDVMASYQVVFVFRDPGTKELFQEEEVIPIFLAPHEVGNWKVADEKFLKVALSWLETQRKQRGGLKIDSCLVYDPRGRRREELEPLLRSQK